MTKQWWLAVAGAFAMPAFACDELTVADAWVRLAPPTAPVMAGYLTLANTGKDAVTLRGGSSADFERVELHNMTHENGVMQMRKLDAIEVPPGGEVALAPGGMHLMLIGPKHSLVAGDQVEIVLQVCDGQQQTVSLPVREAAPAAADEHSQHAP